MTLSPRERERLEALVAAYRRLPREEPPEAVDAAVLKNARAALRASSRSRWPTLLATAATMTLAIGLAWQLREAEDRIEVQRPAEVAPAPAAAPGPASGHDAPRSPAASAPVPVLEDAPNDAGDAGDDADASVDAVLGQARVKPDAAEREAATGGLSRKERRADPAPALGARAAQAPKSEARPFPAVEKSSQPSTPPPDAQPAETDELREALPPPAAPAPQRAGTDASATRAPATRDAAANASRESEEKRSQDVLGLGRGERTPATGAARSPRAWLDEITRLLRTGQRERAIESLREFRRAHPQVELPPELRDLSP